MAENMSDCSEYHRLKYDLLADIGKDTDKILAKLENKGDCMDMSAFLAAQAANNNRGLSNDAAFAMMNGGMNGMWNNPFMYLIWLAMFGYGGNGCGGGLFGRGGNCNNGAAESMLLQAINAGSATSQRDIDRLASAMGCGQSEIRNGLSVINASLCQIANNVGMSVPQIVNAIQAGNSSLAAQLAQCCCENRLAICQQTNALTNGQSQLGFLIQNEGNQTRQLMTQQNYEAQLREMTKENNELRTSAQTSVLLNRADNNTAAVVNALSGITNQLTALAAAVARIPTTTTA